MKPYERLLNSLGVIAFMAIMLSFSSAAYAIAGKFQFVNGEVLVIDASGKQHAVKKGDTINEGDTVAASSTGFAQIKMEDGGFFAVRPDTRFKVDTFKFNGKDDGSEKGIFSLIKGSLRSVTGLIGKKHRDNYKIQTATSTIGIRGSGADVGHDDAVGTAVRTLFGGHSLTSNGKTVDTHPGETALAQPGQDPKLVSNFPFSTSNGKESGTGGNNQANNKPDNANKPTTEAKNDKPDAGEDKEVFIPVLTEEGINLTENKTASGDDIGSSINPPTGNYIHHISAVRATPTTGFWHAEQNSDDFYSSASNYSLDSNGYLIGVNDSELEVSDAGTSVVAKTSSSLSVVSGTLVDAYHTPDNSIYLGRLQNGVVETCYASTCSTATFINAHSILAIATTPALVQTMTGSVSYVLGGSTHPTDAFGNVGTLNSAYLTANFTNQTADFGLNLTIASKTLNAYATARPIINGGFEAKGAQLNITGGSYTGNVGGAILGTSGASAALGYDFYPSSNATGPYTDFITGLIAFTGSTPTAISSYAAPTGSGVAAVALFSSGDPALTANPLNEFNINDNAHFASRNDGYGALLSFSRAGSGGGTELSFGRGGATLANTGVASTGAYTVVWGRWDGNFTANSNTNGSGYPNSPSGTGNLHFIQSNQITANLSPAVLGVTTAVYNGTTGTVPTSQSGALGSTSVLNASIAVNFNTQQITSYNLTTGGGGLGTWQTSVGGGSGAITDFMGVNGIALSGTCSSAASGACAPGASFTGKATGAFVGSHAEGLISTYSLSSTGSDKLVGTVYTQR